MMTDRVSILIVEDEPIIADDLAITLEGFGYQIADICASADEALKAMDRNLPDIALLDVKIKGDKDGIQLGLLIRQQYQVPFVFITSLYDQNTLKRAKNANPAGYLVKPFKESDLKVTVELALSKRQWITETPLDTLSPDINLFVRKEGSLVPINYAEVSFIEASDNYSQLYIGNEKHVVSHTLKEIEEKLLSKGFCRVHKTYLVNLSKIDRIEQSVLFIGEKMIPIGKVYKKPFFDRLTVF